MQRINSIKRDYVALKVILHQKFQFVDSIVCCLVVTQCSKQNKEFRVTQNRWTQAAVKGHGPLPPLPVAATLDIEVILWKQQRRLVVLHLDKRVIKKDCEKAVDHKKHVGLNENQTRGRFENRVKALISTDGPFL